MSEITIQSYNTIDSKKVKSYYAYAGLDCSNVRDQINGTKVRDAYRVKELVVDYFSKKFNCKVPINDATVESHSRLQELVACRHACMYWIRQNTNLTMSQIGRMFGNRDHSTVLHGISRYNQFLDVEKSHRRLHAELADLLSY
jgi:chromosomal replication initiator protein